MASKYELTQGTRLKISKSAATEANPINAKWLDLGGTVTEFSYSATNYNAGEITFLGNWVIDDEAQKALRAAYDNDATHSFKITFPSGKGYAFMAEVRQNSFSVAKGAVVTASYTLRIKGKLVEF